MNWVPPAGSPTIFSSSLTLPLFSGCLSVCLHICPSLCSSCSLLSVMSLQQQQKTQHPPDHDSITDILLHIFFPTFKFTLNSRCLWFLPDYYLRCCARGQEPAGKTGRALWLPFPPNPTVSDESRVDSGSGSSNAARQLLQKHNYSNTRAACLPVSWLAGGWNGHSRRSEKEPRATLTLTGPAAHECSETRDYGKYGGTK